MNGREVQLWAGLGGFPNKILPGGYVMGTTGTRHGKKAYQDQIDLVQVDWDGNIVWKFDKTELIAPSAAAVMICLSSFVLTSPATKNPGTDVTPSSPALM